MALYLKRKTLNHNTSTVMPKIKFQLHSGSEISGAFSMRLSIFTNRVEHFEY